MSNKIRITLVHGTFARNAEWVKPGSKLCKGISRELGDLVEFQKPIIWSGCNSVRHRQEAAHCLMDEVNKCKSRHPEDLQLVIGHSHGGNVAAYALKNKNFASMLSGVAFLATPFVAVRAQPNSKKTARVLVISVITMIWFSLMLLIMFTRRWTGIYYLPYYIDELVLGLIHFSIGILIFATNGWISTRIVALVMPKIELAISHLSTSVLPSGPSYLFIRSTGDEAAGMLSAVYILVWPVIRLLMRFSNALAHVIGKIGQVWSSGYALRCGLLVVCFLISMSVFQFISYYTFINDFRQSSWAGISLMDAFMRLILRAPIVEGDYYYFASIPAWVNEGIDLIRKIILVLSCIVTVSAVVILSLFFLMTGLVLLSCLAFGVPLARVGPFIELAVEPTPVGDWYTHRLDWNDAPTTNRGLSHSFPYTSPGGIATICDWIRACAERGNTR